MTSYLGIMKYLYTCYSLQEQVNKYCSCETKLRIGETSIVTQQMCIDVDELIQVNLFIFIPISVSEPHFQVLINIYRRHKTFQHFSHFISGKKIITVQINIPEKFSSSCLDLLWDVVVNTDIDIKTTSRSNIWSSRSSSRSTCTITVLWDAPIFHFSFEHLSVLGLYCLCKLVSVASVSNETKHHSEVERISLDEEAAIMFCFRIVSKVRSHMGLVEDTCQCMS